MRRQFLKGQIVFAQIEEINSDRSYVCSLSGRLLRIENKTAKQHSVGDEIKLQVVQVDPLVFALFEDRKSFERRV